MIALPALEAMLPKIARAASPSPTRLVVFFVPNGIHMPNWTPTDTGPNYQLPPILAPLQPVKDDVLVLTGLANRPGIPDGPGDHAAGTGAFISAHHVFKTEGTDIQGGISMDQVAANAIGQRTRFPSLQLGAEGGDSAGTCDSGYSCAYPRNISWASPMTPLAKEINPQALFDRLFRGVDPHASGAERERKRIYKKSLLDFVQDDTARLQAKLGAGDRRRLDDYLTGIRELEKRLDDQSGSSCAQNDRPDPSSDVRQTVQAMNDLMVTALQCDLTRVITFMLGNAGSNRVYTFLGIGEGHHQISHHQNNPVNFAELTTIDTWEVQQLADLLQKMKAIAEPDGTLLDNTLVLFSSEIEDGDAHRHTNLPVLVAGKGQGAFKPGRHVRLGEEKPIANLFVSMLDAVGVGVQAFGDNGTAPLSEVSG
jgi:hypothetical protein